MKREAEFEMRPEYDFSVGGRGRHAARFTPAEREELVQRATVQDFQSWTADALLQVQELEAALFTYLVLARKRSPEQAAFEALSLLGDSAVADGGVFPGSHCRGLLLDELDPRLALVSKERDWLVHRSGLESHVALSVPAKALALLDRLEHLTVEASSLKAQIGALVSQHLSEDGLSKQEILNRANETRNRWLAA